ncbi:MAG: F0F1 ATP synthase subunit alpha [Actinobacteria bacterium]|nr:F0F1 ATP synthase subunit alpha [Actinomycetota bacterium]
MLFLSDDKVIDLDIGHQWVDVVEKELLKIKEQIDFLTIDDMSGHIKKIIENTKPLIEVKEISSDRGEVLQVGDGIARISGLRHVGANEIVLFEGGIYGLAFNLEREAVGCILLGAEEGIREGSSVEITGHLLEVPVGDELIGRIVNALGQPIDGKGPIEAKSYRLVERKAPGVVARQPVSEPLQTGVKAIDALVPVGRGQRELIIGDRKIGKTTIAIDTIINQKDSGVICIYAAIGQKASTIGRVVKILEQKGALKYTIIVAALSNEQTAFRFLVPYTACAIGEEIMERGGHALVIYDDLSKHGVAYREMSALLKRPIGREAYPGDIFYVHSRLLERAAKLKDSLGGGSLTALPIIETLGGDVTSYISTNVISITDGQIYLESDLFNTGFRPSINVGLSVSRVGGAAQCKAMKKVAGRLRIDLSQYHEMSAFVKFGAELDEATHAQLVRGERGRQLLIQPQYSPLSMEKQVVLLYAVVNGYIDFINVEMCSDFESKLLSHLEANHPSILVGIKQSGDLTSELEERLKKALEDFIDFFKKESEQVSENE